MEILQQTFKHHLSVIEDLLQKARGEENPARWLYTNNLRTPFFMLEALCRVYKKIANKELFDKLNTHFKMVEDALGQVDYYDAFAKEINTNNKDSLEIKNYFVEETLKKEVILNDILTEKGWLSGERIEKIRKKLSEIPYQEEKEEVADIKNCYLNIIEKLNDFSESGDFKFDDIEDNVHDMRRKLRWLSIYPAAFLGVFQYASRASADLHLEKYMTPKIVNSSFNKLPNLIQIENHILLDKHYFFSLSWIIAEVGRLKDEGLKLEAYKEALTAIRKQEPSAKEIQKYAESNLTLNEIIKEAERAIRPFFEEKNLLHLVIG